MDPDVAIGGGHLCDPAKLANFATLGIGHDIAETENKLPATPVEDELTLLSFSRDALSNGRSSIRWVFFEQYAWDFNRVLDVIWHQHAVLRVSFNFSALSLPLLNRSEAKLMA